MSFFGTTFSFSLAGKQKFKTFLGGLISLVILITVGISLASMALEYMNSSMIGDVVKVSSFASKSQDDMMKNIKLIFWFSKLEVVGRPEIMKKEELKKYFDIESYYINEFSNKETGQVPIQMDLEPEECKNFDQRAMELIKQASMVGFQRIEPKLCLKTIKENKNIKPETDDDNKKQNMIVMNVKFCKKAQRADCDEDGQKKIKFFFNYLYNEKIIKIQEAGRSVTLWAKKQEMTDDDLIPVFSSHLMKDESARELKVYVNYKQVIVDFTFESLAKLIRKIPLMEYILRIFYDNRNKLVGFERLRTDINESDKRWGGVALRINSYSHVDSYLIQFISPLDFLFQVIYLFKFFYRLC